MGSKPGRWYPLTHPNAHEHVRRNPGQLMDVRYPRPGAGYFAWFTIRIEGACAGSPETAPRVSYFAWTRPGARRLRVGGDSGELRVFAYGRRLRWRHVPWFGSWPEAVLLGGGAIRGGQYRIRGGQPMPILGGFREGDLSDRFGQGDPLDA